MDNSKREKELQRDLNVWLGQDFKKLSLEEQKNILKVYDRLTESSLRDPLETIRKITDKEFNYGILVIGSLYGIALSLFAGAIGNLLVDTLSTKDFFAVTAVAFILTTFLLIFTLQGVSRGDAKHWKLLEALQREVKRSSPNPDENRDPASTPDHSPESAASSDQS